MKRRTNPSKSRAGFALASFAPLVPLDSAPVVENPFVFDPNWSTLDMHCEVTHRLESLSDADGWLFFQFRVFPSIDSGQVADMMRIESIWLADRGLTVSLGYGGVSLVRDGDAIAGLHQSLYTSPRVPLPGPV